eukprot:1008197-Amphidinium_carterae.1
MAMPLWPQFFSALRGWIAWLGIRPCSSHFSSKIAACGMLIPCVAWMIERMGVVVGTSRCLKLAGLLEFARLLLPPRSQCSQ